MKKLIIITIFALTYFSWISETQAQDNTQQPTASAQNSANFGIGAGFGGRGMLGFLNDTEVEITSNPASIYFPITFDNFRIEPELGYLRLSMSESDGDFEVTSSMTQLGLGIFGLRNTTERSLIYYGARLGMLRESTDANFLGTSESDSFNHLYFGPAIGSEYYATESISAGAEIQLQYYALDAGDDDVSVSVFQSNAIFFVRLHF